MEDLFQNPAVIWFLIGLVLLLTELALPGLVVMFFGFGAWMTGLAFLLFDLSFNAQLAVFIGSSVLNLVLLRGTLKNRWWKKQSSQNELTDEFVGRTCTVSAPILPGPGGGKVIFKGTTWKALAPVQIPAGEVVRITGKDSIVLLVEPITPTL